MAQNIIYSPWGGAKGPWPCLMTELLWFCPVWLLFLCFCIYSLLWLNLFFYFSFIFWSCHVACRILVSLPGIEPGPSAVKAWSPNHWTTREFPKSILWLKFFYRQKKGGGHGGGKSVPGKPHRVLLSFICSTLMTSNKWRELDVLHTE